MTKLIDLERFLGPRYPQQKLLDLLPKAWLGFELLLHSMKCLVVSIIDIRSEIRYRLFDIHWHETLGGKSLQVKPGKQESETMSTFNSVMSSLSSHIFSEFLTTAFTTSCSRVGFSRTHLARSSDMPIFLLA